MDVGRRTPVCVSIQRDPSTTASITLGGETASPLGSGSLANHASLLKPPMLTRGTGQLVSETTSLRTYAAQESLP